MQHIYVHQLGYISHHGNFCQLMQVLSDPICRGAISWSADGKSFAILRKSRFIEEVLPLYFRQCQMASFQRKLNRWGFRVIHIFTEGRQDSAYHHEV